MSRFQIGAVAICVALNAMDGFDVLSISFASPGIAAEWGIDRASLGIVLSMELIGMAVGSLGLGGVADRIGRRPTILGCLAFMATGMFLAATAPNLTLLALCRLLTGVGIGGMLAAINAMAAEFSNRKRRSLAVTIMAAGYPMGAVLGGAIASMLIAQFDWRAVFLFGGFVTAAFIPLVLWRLPESIEFLIHRPPAKALDRVNATMRRMGFATVSRLPDPEPDAPRASFANLFAPGIAATTVMLTLTYFFHIMTFYFVLKWIPKIVADMGFAPAAAAGVLVWANVGGVTGSLLFSFLTRRFPLQLLVALSLLCASAMVIAFGRISPDLTEITVMAAITGFFTNAVVVGLYALIAQGFPTALRASGTGFVIGVGRGGAALGPMAAGFLFALGYGLPVVTIVMAGGSLFGAVAIIALRGRAQSRAAATG